MDAIENVARYTKEEMKGAIEVLDQDIKKKERLAYHFTSKATAAIIMAEGSFGLRASTEGQKGGGLFVCKTPPHEMGWDMYGGRAWREGVGKKLWGTKWKEVLLDGLHADKLEAVIIIKIWNKAFDDDTQVLEGRESVLVIPSPYLKPHGDHFYLPKEDVVKVYALDSTEEAADVTIESAAHWTPEEMQRNLAGDNDNIAKEYELAYHFTSKKTADLILSSGLRASTEGRVSVSKQPPHEMGWEQWGGGQWPRSVGNALWGEKSNLVWPGGPHADKLEMVVVVKVLRDIFDNNDYTLQDAYYPLENVLIIPPSYLEERDGSHYYAKNKIVKVYELRATGS